MFENMGASFPVWSWILQEAEVLDDPGMKIS